MIFLFSLRMISLLHSLKIMITILYMIMRISKINNVIDVGCYNINDTNVSNILMTEVKYNNHLMSFRWSVNFIIHTSLDPSMKTDKGEWITR